MVYDMYGNLYLGDNNYESNIGGIIKVDAKKKISDFVSATEIASAIGSNNL